MSRRARTAFAIVLTSLLLVVTVQVCRYPHDAWQLLKNQSDLMMLVVIVLLSPLCIAIYLIHWKVSGWWSRPVLNPAELEWLIRPEGQVTLPLPTRAKAHTGCLLRIYEMPTGLVFDLLSFPPDVDEDNHVVPESEWLEGFFGCLGAPEMQERLEREEILRDLGSVVWREVSSEFCPVKRVLRIQAREVAELVRLIGRLNWTPRGR